MKYERIRNMREDMDKTQTEVAKYYNCSVDYLLGITDVKEPYPEKKRI